MARPKIENVTEELQRYLGIQQAQTFQMMDVTADAIGRLLEQRGNVERLVDLWKEAPASVVIADGYEARKKELAFKAFREAAYASLKVSTRRDGTPKTFKPYVPELISSTEVGKTFREMGRSVIEGLWLFDLGGEVCDRIKERVQSWRGQHALAELARTFCAVRPLERARDQEIANLAVASSRDVGLAEWIKTVVREDWEAWLRLSVELSVDEQLEAMNALIALQLHVAMLWRLRDMSLPLVPPFFFAVVAGQSQEPSCNRAAYNSFKFWRDRAEDALRSVARDLIVSAAESDAELKASLNCENWTKPALWETIEIKERQRPTATNRFRTRVHEVIEERGRGSDRPAVGEVEQIVVQALCEAFSRGPLEKTKDYLRNTGRGAGIVGPEGGSRRKRYQLDNEALELMARMHAVRPEESVRSTETEKRSVEAFLDDIFARYGVIITTEREGVDELIRSLRNRQGTKLSSLLAHLPEPGAMAENRATLEARLDDLRLMRRYSDASAVIHIG